LRFSPQSTRQSFVPRLDAEHPEGSVSGNMLGVRLTLGVGDGTADDGAAACVATIDGDGEASGAVTVRPHAVITIAAATPGP
jgi:hypothetical protein